MMSLKAPHLDWICSI